MARSLRILGDGLVYHAISRGHNRADVLRGDADHRALLETLGRARGRFPFRLYGDCLMTNRFHRLLRPGPGQAISRIPPSLRVAHTWRDHRRHRGVGHVWQGRFTSPVIQDGAHLRTVLRSLAANPRRAGMVADLADDPRSSDPAHGLGREDPRLDPLPEWDELGRDEAERRARWRRRVHRSPRPAELGAVRASVRRGRP